MPRKGVGSALRRNGSVVRQDLAALDLAEAKAVFDRLVALEAAYDPALGDLYAEDAILIETTVENGTVRRTTELPARRYKAHLPDAMAFAQKVGEQFVHSDTCLDHMEPGWVAVRSLRGSRLGRAPGTYQLIIRRCPDGAWRICKETATRIV